MRLIPNIFGRAEKKEKPPKPEKHYFSYTISTKDFFEEYDAPKAKTKMMVKLFAIFKANEIFAENTQVEIVTYQDGNVLEMFENIFTYKKT